MSRTRAATLAVVSSLLGLATWQKSIYCRHWEPCLPPQLLEAVVPCYHQVTCSTLPTNPMEAQKCEPISTFSDGQRVWRLIKIIDKYNYTSDSGCGYLVLLTLRWLIQVYPLHPDRWSRYAKHTSAPSFVI